MQLRRSNRSRVPVPGVPGVIATAGMLLLTSCGLSDGEGPAADEASGRQPAASTIDCATQGKVLGTGSTAQQNAMKQWIKNYQQACKGVQVAYWGEGSGAGVAQFLLGETAFGGSDSALKPGQADQSKRVCPGGRAIDLPMLGGTIAIGYHLSGVDGLVLDAPTLARIFDSEITRWDDPAIRQLNPDAELPALPIQAVHRSDDSGTTQNLNAYLAGAAPEQWPYPKEKTWQGKGGQAASGSDGVASEVEGNDGAIGYFELSFAAARDISTVRIDTGAAEPVAATVQTASAGIGSAEIVGTDGDLTLKLDYATKAEGAYPIVMVTYEIVCNRGNNPETLPALKSFLSYTAGEEGQQALPEIHYAPLPAGIAAKVREVIPTLS
ncbi:phosphate ABC transporter substrate-binding protein PstS [Streptomyces sp. SYSU K217416]